MMEAQQIVGWNLRRLRVARGITIEELADRAEIDASYLSRVERGSANPSIGVVDRLARALGARLRDVVEELPPGGKPPAPLRAGRKRRFIRNARGAW